MGDFALQALRFVLKNHHGRVQRVQSLQTPEPMTNPPKRDLSGFRVDHLRGLFVQMLHEGFEGVDGPALQIRFEMSRGSLKVAFDYLALAIRLHEVEENAVPGVFIVAKKCVVLEVLDGGVGVVS